MSRANVAALIARYGHPPAQGAIRLGEAPTTATVRPMGPLVELTLERFRDGQREVWSFDPRPRLVFTRRTKRMWVMGGGFRIDGNGFHNHHGASGLQRESVEAARNDERNQYGETVYLLEPNIKRSRGGLRDTSWARELYDRAWAGSPATGELGFLGRYATQYAQQYSAATAGPLWWRTWTLGLAEPRQQFSGVF